MLHEFFVKPLIKLSWQRRIEMMRIAASDLFGEDAGEREFRQGIEGEEGDFAGFGVSGINAAFIIEQIAQEKELVSSERIRRMRMTVAVINGDQFCGANAITRLFKNFADDSGRRGLAGVCPAAGKRPAEMIELFLDEQDAIVLKNSRADIDFGRGMTGLGVENGFDLIEIGVSPAREHLSGDGENLLVALAIKRRRIVKQTALGDCLEALRPDEPLRCGHDKDCSLVRQCH